MPYTIKAIDFFVRETQPARFPSALGKAAQQGVPRERPTSPLCHTRMIVEDESGSTAFGCSADRLSVRWLDKRPGRVTALKRRELAALIHQAKAIYLSQPQFETPFEKWWQCHGPIMHAGRAAHQEDLTSSFASALLERAMLDAVCRLAGRSLFEMLRDDSLGFRPARVHAELGALAFPRLLPRRPTTDIYIRHTVGIFDPLTAEDLAELPAHSRPDDGLPETLRDYIQRDGIRYFKVKISGDPAADLRRLGRLWEVLPQEIMPVITLDANEAFADPEVFVRFLRRLEDEQLGLFQHIRFVEQPLRRDLALQPATAKWIREAGRIKDVIIDESDGTVNAFRRAWDLGYSGTSHKNCKGVFKSLMNYALAGHLSDGQRQVVLSGEDLQNLPIVPLQQDFVTVGILGLEHCERNGHHYNYGLSMLPAGEKAVALRRHADLYERRGNEGFLRIEDGRVHCPSLHGPGYGVQDEPQWDTMRPLQQS